MEGMSEPRSDGHVPLTGAQFDIRGGEYQATVTELGAGLRQLSHGGRPIIFSYDPDQLPPAGSGQLLCPWPNRIEGGRYDFDGTAYQVDLSEPVRGNAIHGLTRWINWEPVHHATDEITLTHTLLGRTGYPFCLELSATYRLDAVGLTVTIGARNAGSRPAPYGTGSHPYLTTGAPLVDQCTLQVPASHWLPTDDRGIPSGPAQDVSGTMFDFRAPRAIGDARLDHALTSLARDAEDRIRVRLSSSELALGLWAGPGYSWIQVFTGDPLGPNQRRRALAVEPMTCPANAFVTGQDLLTLAPGEKVTHSWGVGLIHP
jgi:aldose 1-epimerase